MKKARRRAKVRTDKKPERLTLDLEGPRITADSFKKAVGAFVDLIHTVSAKLAGDSKSIRWIITVKDGSVHLSATPEALRPQVQVPQVVRAITTGLRTVERRAQRPANFTDDALRRVYDLANVPDGHDITLAKIVGTQGSVSVSRNAADHVETILGTAVADYGSIEGKLQTISVRGGFHVIVYDDLTDERVRCVTDDTQLPTVVKALGKRVAVSGVIRYRKTGEPISVRVEDIDIFPDDADLPTADDVYGILSSD